MNRKQLEHVLRAGGSVAAETDLVVVGSQALLATVAHPPAELVQSMEADLYPLHAPEKADLIDGSIGELSPFHRTFGYYAHGVSPETAILADGWKDRVVKIESPDTAGVVGWCISPIDLAVSKLAAGREKDLHFVRAMLRHGLVAEEDVSQLAAVLPADKRELVRDRLVGLRAR